jgi:hypothetical protein
MDDVGTGLALSSQRQKTYTGDTTETVIFEDEAGNT